MIHALTVVPKVSNHALASVASRGADFDAPTSRTTARLPVGSGAQQAYSSFAQLPSTVRGEARGTNSLGIRCKKLLVNHNFEQDDVREQPKVSQINRLSYNKITQTGERK